MACDFVFLSDKVSLTRDLMIIMFSDESMSYPEKPDSRFRFRKFIEMTYIKIRVYKFFQNQVYVLAQYGCKLQGVQYGYGVDCILVSGNLHPWWKNVYIFIFKNFFILSNGFPI